MFGELVAASEEGKVRQKAQQKQSYKTAYTAFSLLHHIYCKNMSRDGKS